MYMITISLDAVFGGLSNVHAEHDHFGCHGGHLVAEAVLEFSVHVSRKRILSIGLPITTVDDTTIWATNLCTWKYMCRTLVDCH